MRPHVTVASLVVFIFEVFPLKKLLILFFPLFLFISQTYGQANLPPVYQITNDTTLSTEIPTGYWKMLEDKEGKLVLDQVIKSPVADDFHFNQSKDNRFNYAVHTCWFCYRLSNAMNHDAEICFWLDFTQIPTNERSTFYLFRGGQMNEFENGSLAPASKFKNGTLNNYIPIVLKPGEVVTIYNRVHNLYIFPFSPAEYSIVFNSTKKIQQQNEEIDLSLYTDSIQNSILFGILLFAFAFNFFFFLIVKERVYLYFALYVLIMGIGRVLFETYFVFFREARDFWAWLYLIIFNSNFFIMVLFIRSLLKTYILIPRWDRILNGVNYASIIINFLAIVVPYYFPAAHNQIPNKIIIISKSGTQILLMICILLSFFIVLKKRDKANRELMFLILPALCIWELGFALYTLYLDFGSALFSEKFIAWLDSWWTFTESVCLSWLVLAFSWILLQRFRKLQNRITQQQIEREKEKTALIEQKRIELEKTVEERTSELKLSLETLQSTQHQLIQSEKMASLGELMAGIAHEIQNPLNFVNNFSDINRELLSEMKEEIKNGNIDGVITMAGDIIENETKINHHGKRADAIVKGMLQHSRSGSGQKENTNMNALADEYLRLAYQGFRVRDKSFNAILETDFDPSIGDVYIIPQDIGRVLLNLYNNAFYALSEKKNQQLENYKPAVSVSTKRLGDKVEIRVKDNGNGIPTIVIDKIFQPFFTTKPAGQGTGLGLSLSYDILKAHGGELKVVSQEGKGTEFIIQIPIVSN
jgi:two-component system, NtrC family, sensor kinase